MMKNCLFAALLDRQLSAAKAPELNRPVTAQPTDAGVGIVGILAVLFFIGVIAVKVMNSTAADVCYTNKCLAQNEVSTSLDY